MHTYIHIHTYIHAYIQVTSNKCARMCHLGMFALGSGRSREAIQEHRARFQGADTGQSKRWLCSELQRLLFDLRHSSNSCNSGRSHRLRSVSARSPSQEHDTVAAEEQGDPGSVESESAAGTCSTEEWVRQQRAATQRARRDLLFICQARAVLTEGALARLMGVPLFSLSVCMYVCMYDGRAFDLHVCMDDVCMYVCVCM